MPERSLVVLTQNAWGRAPFWEHRRDSLARMIAAERPDIVGLQEVCADSKDAPSQAHQLASAVGDFDAWFLPARKLGGGGYEGVAMLVRHGCEVIARREIALSLDPADPLEGKRQRVALALTVRSYDRAVDAIVTHLSLSKLARERTIPDLLVFAEPRPGSGVDSTVIMGDFNALPNEPTLETFGEEGWIDAWRHANPGDVVGGTWPAGLPFRRIDYIWVRLQRDWQIGACMRTEVSGSDHLGVRARFVWTETGSSDQG